MILIGVGSNLGSARGGPQATCEAALERLQARGVALRAVSPWYETAPVPVSDQPWFVNGVAVVATDMSAEELMETLLDVELELGRRRSVPNAARAIDLDLLAYDDVVVDGALQIPHPRMAERAFVLLPLRDLAPDWCHPVSGQSLSDMIENLPEGQEIHRV